MESAAQLRAEGDQDGRRRSGQESRIKKQKLINFNFCFCKNNKRTIDGQCLDKLETKVPNGADQQVQKAVASGTTAKSAHVVGYRIACDKCPSSWQEGVFNQEDLWAKLVMSEQKSVVNAAKGKPALGMPWKQSPSFRTEHKDLDEHGLEAAWATIGVPGHKRWCKEHPVCGLARKTLIANHSSVGNRRAKVPKVFRTAHAGENVALMGKKWTKVFVMLFSEVA